MTSSVGDAEGLSLVGVRCLRGAVSAGVDSGRFDCPDVGGAGGGGGILLVDDVAYSRILISTSSGGAAPPAISASLGTSACPAAWSPTVLIMYVG